MRPGRFAPYRGNCVFRGSASEPWGTSPVIQHHSFAPR
nr:MAG TPA: hypothetical protein [Caudoviricetes sp.]